MGYVREHTVYKHSTLKECYLKTGKAPIETRWIDINKGDDENPSYRSRWVAKDFRRAWVETVFAATPNIESVRLLLASAANTCKTTGNLKGNTCVMIIDISRAYFYAPAQKDMYIKLPPEDPRAGEEGICGKLKMSLYGTRDAGANWHLAYSSFLRRIGMAQGAPLAILWRQEGT